MRRRDEAKQRSWFKMFAVARLVSSETAPAFSTPVLPKCCVRCLRIRLNHLVTVMPAPRHPARVTRPGQVFAGIHGLLRTFAECLCMAGQARLKTTKK